MSVGPLRGVGASPVADGCGKYDQPQATSYRRERTMSDETASSSQRTDTEVDWSQLHLNPEAAQAAMAQSDRMQGPTVSVRDRGLVTRPVQRHDRRLRSGRPAVRGSSRRSSARSGDSGDDGEPSEPEPHPEAPARRLCQFCGRDIPADRSPRARYCSDQHADRDRQRRKRHRDRERDVRPPTPQPADFWRMRQITDEDLRRLREFVACRCNGRHLEFDPGECFRCGHSLPREVAA